MAKSRKSNTSIPYKSPFLRLCNPSMLLIDAVTIHTSVSLWNIRGKLPIFNIALIVLETMPPVSKDSSIFH